MEVTAAGETVTEPNFVFTADTVTPPPADNGGGVTAPPTGRDDSGAPLASTGTDGAGILPAVALALLVAGTVLTAVRRRARIGR